MLTIDTMIRFLQFVQRRVVMFIDDTYSLLNFFEKMDTRLFQSRKSLF